MGLRTVSTREALNLILGVNSSDCPQRASPFLYKETYSEVGRRQQFAALKCESSGRLKQ